MRNGRGAAKLELSSFDVLANWHGWLEYPGSIR
jgi:hypothetical protein